LDDSNYDLCGVEMKDKNERTIAMSKDIIEKIIISEYRVVIIFKSKKIKNEWIK